MNCSSASPSCRGGVTLVVLHSASWTSAAAAPDYLRKVVLDSSRLEIPGRKGLEIDHGNPIAEII